jgi:hypothetical protein
MAIPRLIVQTHRSEDVLRDLRATWQRHHPEYEYRFYDDARCRTFLADRLPALLPTYDALPLPVQRADLFRYAAVYELGGVYADADTVCCAPLHDYVDLAQGTLYVGMEMTPAHYRDNMARYVKHYCSPFQLLQWTFCAPPRHPVLAALLERIGYLVGQLRGDYLARCSREMRFTLELTGPMMFTHVVNEFLCGSRPTGAVAVLPRLTWGSLPPEQVLPELAGRIKVRHLFTGDWKPCAGVGQPRASG